jgi:hypothetical protein
MKITIPVQEVMYGTIAYPRYETGKKTIAEKHRSPTLSKKRRKKLKAKKGKS